MSLFFPSLARVHKDHEAELSISYPIACRLAKAGNLNGVEPNPNGFGWQVMDKAAAVASMKLTKD